MNYISNRVGRWLAAAVEINENITAIGCYQIEIYIKHSAPLSEGAVERSETEGVKKIISTYKINGYKQLYYIVGANCVRPFLFAMNWQATAGRPYGLCIDYNLILTVNYHISTTTQRRQQATALRCEIKIFLLIYGFYRIE